MNSLNSSSYVPYPLAASLATTVRANCACTGVNTGMPPNTLVGLYNKL